MGFILIAVLTAALWTLNSVFSTEAFVVRMVFTGFAAVCFIGHRVLPPRVLNLLTAAVCSVCCLLHENLTSMMIMASGALFAFMCIAAEFYTALDASTTAAPRIVVSEPVVTAFTHAGVDVTKWFAADARAPHEVCNIAALKKISFNGKSPLSVSSNGTELFVVLPKLP